MDNKIRAIHMIGIGGSGMSGIAEVLLNLGYTVHGSDLSNGATVRRLRDLGAVIHVGHSAENLDDPQVVVRSSAVSDDNPEVAAARERRIPVIPRAEMLAELMRLRTGVAIAGTHGKTTTSTLTAHILTESKEGCSAFLGGISKNYGTNMLMSKTPTVVAEADEFDRSFLQLHPAIAAITAMDADHLDIYGDLEHVQEAFRNFASQVSETLILKYGCPISQDDISAKIYTYHFNDERADIHSTNLRLSPDGHYTYDLVYPAGVLKDIRVGTLGWVNVENSIAAATICLCYGTDAQKIRHAIGTFQGAQRRLDEHVNKPGLTYIDDYAHHPAELSTAISSIRGIFPGRRITAVFQPHLYTRTRDFAKEFAEALSGVDKLILLDIYPARELPIEGVTSEIIFKDVTAPEKVMLHREELMDYLEKEDLDVLVTFGAGNIDRFIEPITEMLERR